MTPVQTSRMLLLSRGIIVLGLLMGFVASFFLHSDAWYYGSNATLVVGFIGQFYFSNDPPERKRKFKDFLLPFGFLVFFLILIAVSFYLAG